MRERILQTLCRCHSPMEVKGKSWRRKLILDWFKSLTVHYLYDKLAIIPTWQPDPVRWSVSAKYIFLQISQAITVRNIISLFAGNTIFWRRGWQKLPPYHPSILTNRRATSAHAGLHRCKSRPSQTSAASSPRGPGCSRHLFYTYGHWYYLRRSSK